MRAPLFHLGDEETRQNEAVGHVIPQDNWRHPHELCFPGSPGTLGRHVLREGTAPIGTLRDTPTAACQPCGEEGMEPQRCSGQCP